MTKFRIGRLDEPWIDIEPPISRTSDTYTAKNDISSISAVESLKGGRNTQYMEKLEAVPFLPTEKDLQDMPAPTARKWLEDHSTASRLQADGESYDKEQILRNLRQHEVDIDTEEWPLVDSASQRAISESFQKLHQSVRDRGLYVCKMSNYMKEIARYSTLFALFVLTFRQGWFIVSAVFLGLFWHQIMFSAHDAGHLAITHNFVFDTTIGIFIADFCCGLSIGWWKSSHNVHHLVPNHIVSLNFV